MAKNTDWIAIKNEYINTDISQRNLAKKYNVSFNTLKDRANKEKWADERKKQHNKITAKIQQKTADKIVQTEVDRITTLLTLTDKAQEQIDIAFGQLNKHMDMFGNVSDTDIIDVHRLKKLVSALKDIKDILHEDKHNENADVMSKLDSVIGEVDKLAK